MDLDDQVSSLRALQTISINLFMKTGDSPTDIEELHEAFPPVSISVIYDIVSLKLQYKKICGS